MQRRFEKALIYIAELIYRITWQAWMKLAKRSTIGEILARLRHAEQRCLQLQAECDLLRGRLAGMPAGSRPHFSKQARFEILWHIKRYGLTMTQAAEIFMVTRETISRWLRRHWEGSGDLVVPRRPVNRLADLKRELVHRLKQEQSGWGTRRICQILVRLGLKLSRRSVQRILREPKPRKRPPSLSGAGRIGRPIRARHPMHVAMIDLTSVQLPLIRKIWIGAVVDVFSRKVLAIRAWSRTPKARDLRTLLSGAIKRYGRPRYLITDQGTQFTANLFTQYLKRQKIRRRYGAVGKFQSVAIIDRFHESLKREYTGQWILLLPTRKINEAIQRYIFWHGRYRPHQGLGGATPDELFSPRPKRCLQEEPIQGLRLTHVDGDRKLPIYQRRMAA